MKLQDKLNELYLKLDNLDTEEIAVQVKLDELPDQLDKDPVYNALMDSKHAIWEERKIIKNEINLLNDSRTFEQADFTGATNGDR